MPRPDPRWIAVPALALALALGLPAQPATASVTTVEAESLLPATSWANQTQAAASAGHQAATSTANAPLTWTFTDAALVTMYGRKATSVCTQRYKVDGGSWVSVAVPIASPTEYSAVLWSVDVTGTGSHSMSVEYSGGCATTLDYLTLTAGPPETTTTTASTTTTTTSTTTTTAPSTTTTTTTAPPSTTTTTAPSPDALLLAEVEEMHTDTVLGIGLVCSGLLVLVGLSLARSR